MYYKLFYLSYANNVFRRLMMSISTSVYTTVDDSHMYQHCLRLFEFLYERFEFL